VSENRDPNLSTLLLVLLAGAAAGAAVALLTTTKTGKEMRDSVRSWVRGGRGREMAEQAAKSVRDALDGV
jgi:gas vesicle protein